MYMYQMFRHRIKYTEVRHRNVVHLTFLTLYCIVVIVVVFNVVGCFCYAHAH